MMKRMLGFLPVPLRRARAIALAREIRPTSAKTSVSNIDFCVRLIILLYICFYSLGYLF